MSHKTIKRPSMPNLISQSRSSCQLASSDFHAHLHSPIPNIGNYIRRMSTSSINMINKITNHNGLTPKHLNMGSEDSEEDNEFDKMLQEDVTKYLSITPSLVKS